MSMWDLVPHPYVPPAIIVDTGVLRRLASGGLLDALLYSAHQIVIPDLVREELLVASRAGFSDATEALAWINRHPNDVEIYNASLGARSEAGALLGLPSGGSQAGKAGHMCGRPLRCKKNRKR